MKNIAFSFLVFFQINVFCLAGDPLLPENTISMHTLIERALTDIGGSYRDIHSKHLISTYEVLNRELNMFLKFPVDLNVKNENGDTLLHVLSRSIDPYISARKEWDVNFLPFTIIKTLLDYRANPNIQNNLGQTPLHLACKRMASDVIELMVEKGALTTIKDNNELEPIFYARNAFSAYEVPDQWFLQQPNLLEQIVKIFLTTKDFSVNAQDNEGNTLLHYASSFFGHCRHWSNDDMFRFQKYLLDLGANPNLTNNQGQTPLHSSCEWCVLDNRVIALLEKKADPSLADVTGTTPKDLAALRGSSNLVRHMLSYMQSNGNNL